MEEFWGIEVKNGESLKVSPGNGVVLHISQASLGELKDEKGKENVNLFVNVNGKKLVLGTLITNKLPQHQFDMLFERDFELSHNWKSGSVYYYGYKAGKTFEEYHLDRNKTAPLLENEATKAPPADQLNKQNPEKKRCNICCRLFTCEQGLDDHIKAMHDGNKTAPLPGNEATKAPPTDKLNKETLKKVLCSICSRILVSQKGLEAHKKAVHDDKTAPVIGNEATNARPADRLNNQNPEYSCCIVCSRSFTSEQGLKAHIKSMHDGNKTAPLLGNEAMKAPLTNKLNKEILKKVRCSICSRLLGSDKGLEAHTKAVHDKLKSKEDIPFNLETNGKTKPKVNNEKPTDAERVIASNEESDAGREPVKIAETRNDSNTKDDGESTFEDVMTNDDDVADPQVVISKKRPLESVELATVTSIPKKKSRRGKKKAKVN